MVNISTHNQRINLFFLVLIHNFIIISAIPIPEITSGCRCNRLTGWLAVSTRPGTLHTASNCRHQNPTDLCGYFVHLAQYLVRAGNAPLAFVAHRNQHGHMYHGKISCRDKSLDASCRIPPESLAYLPLYIMSALRNLRVILLK